MYKFGISREDDVLQLGWEQGEGTFSGKVPKVLFVVSVLMKEGRLPPSGRPADTVMGDLGAVPGS
jgi:hypothetical protein